MGLMIMQVHKLIGSINRIQKTLPDEFPEEFRNLVSNISLSVKFDLGSYYNIPFGEINHREKLPYDNCYFEISVKNKIFGVLACHDNSERKYFTFFEKRIELNYFIITGLTVSPNESKFGFEYKIDYGSHQSKEFIDDCINVVKCITMCTNILNCSNVELVNNKPSKLKQKFSKLPLFEYKTLHIKQNTKRNIKKGEGSHASPRVHLRRGHIRSLETGNIWVQPCVVGSKEKGMIHKDYKVVH